MAEPLAPRHIGWINVRGLWTLFYRGLRRYLRSSWYSVGGPCVSSLLFLAVFVLAAARHGEMLHGITVAQFIAPGVVVLSLSQTAFESSSIWLLEDKMDGVIWDLLSAPLTPLEVFAGYVLPAMAFALGVAGLVFAMTLAFVDFAWTAPWATLLFAVLAAGMFAQLGLLTGIVAQRWETHSLFENFLVLPLAFLSGSFFTISALPADLQDLILLNPVFYVVDGFRYGLTGHVEGAILPGFGILLGLNIVLGLTAWRLINRGYNIKA